MADRFAHQVAVVGERDAQRGHAPNLPERSFTPFRRCRASHAGRSVGKPLMDIDRRLLGGARGSVALVVALGIAGAVLLVAQAWLLAVVIAAAFDDARVARSPLVALLGVVLARTAVAWGAEAAAGHTSAR